MEWENNAHLRSAFLNLADRKLMFVRIKTMQPIKKCTQSHPFVTSATT